MPKPNDQKIRRRIKFEGTDQEFEISKAVAINADIPTLMSFELLKDGTVRLTYNAIRIPDFTKISGIEIIREG